MVSALPVLLIILRAGRTAYATRCESVLFEKHNTHVSDINWLNIGGQGAVCNFPVAVTSVERNLLMPVSPSQSCTGMPPDRRMTAIWSNDIAFTQDSQHVS
ncbi:hypothetical protein F4776DRAFT_101208 [Hypoxylon sp. NC0597]|nr:hypothetical protein F4776DRAFT_101208 [Hypoxylon sp. NC0597]